MRSTLLLLTTGSCSPSSADTLQCSAPITQPCDTGSPCMSASTGFWHAASKRKARREGPRPRGPSGAIIEFYAAARKITFCIAFPRCTSHLEHEIQLFRDLTETGQISSYSSTRLSFKLMCAESEASYINLNLCLPLSQMSSETTSLGQEYMVNVT